MSVQFLSLEDGKYELRFDEGSGALCAYRYGEPWQDFSGNKLIYLLMQAAINNPWRAAIDEALVVSCLDCIQPEETPKQALARLIQWEKTIALDPKVSNEAAALVADAALAQQAPAAEPVAPGEWSQYIAGMIGAYLKWAPDDPREAAVAGIIERRRKYDAAPLPPQAQPLTPDLEHALCLAELWANGKLIGGDVYEAAAILGAEVKRLRGIK